MACPLNSARGLGKRYELIRAGLDGTRPPNALVQYLVQYLVQISAYALRAHGLTLFLLFFFKFTSVIQISLPYS